MSKRTVYTTITPLPPGISRATVLEFLYTHVEMIDLNPLVEERHPIKPPPKATPEEYHCVWYSLTDKISYLPGGMYNGKVTYQACFHDLHNGLQTHVYAPAGVDIKNKWTIGGSLPGEPTVPQEIGQGIPLSGIYLREDVDLKCNMFMTGFIKKNLLKSHSALVARLVVKAQLVEANSINDSLSERSNLSGSPGLSHAASMRSSMGSPQMSLAYSASVRSTTGGSPGFTPQGSPGLVDQSLYPDPLNPNRNSYAPPRGPYGQQQQGGFDPRYSAQSIGSQGHQLQDGQQNDSNYHSQMQHGPQINQHYQNQIQNGYGQDPGQNYQQDHRQSYASSIAPSYAGSVAPNEFTAELGGGGTQQNVVEMLAEVPSGQPSKELEKGKSGPPIHPLVDRPFAVTPQNHPTSFAAELE
jgi:hypothetical protein